MTEHYFHLNDAAARKAIATLPEPGGSATSEATPEQKSAMATVVEMLRGMGKAELRVVRDKIDSLLAG